MKIQHKKILILAAVILLIPLLGTYLIVLKDKDERVFVSGSKEGTTYVNKNIGFSIDIPIGWEVRDLGEPSDGHYLAFSSPKTQEFFSEKKEICQTEHIAECLGDIPLGDLVFSQITDDEKAETKTVKIGEYEWQRIIFRNSFGGEPYYIMQFPNGQSYGFEVHSSEDVLLEILKTFKQL